MEREHRRLLMERQQRGEEIKRLVAAIASSSAPLPSITEQLAEKEAVVIQIDQRLATIKDELDQIDPQRINKDHLTEILAQFEPLWEVLNQIERTRLVNLVIETMVYDHYDGSVGCTIRTNPSPSAA